MFTFYVNHNNIFFSLSIGFGPLCKHIGKLFFFSLPISIFAMVDSGAKIKWPATAAEVEKNMARIGKMQTNTEQGR